MKLLGSRAFWRVLLFLAGGALMLQVLGVGHHPGAETTVTFAEARADEVGGERGITGNIADDRTQARPRATQHAREGRGK